MERNEAQKQLQIKQIKELQKQRKITSLPDTKSEAES